MQIRNGSQMLTVSW